MTLKATFHIDLPMDDLDLVRRTLGTIGVDLDPISDMLHLPQENLLYSVFTGRDGQYAVNRLNEYLKQEDRPKRIPDFDHMSPETRRELLELATLHVEWTSDYEPGIDGLDSNALQSFLEGNPELLEAAV